MELVRTLVAARAGHWLGRISGGALVFWAVLVLLLRDRLPGAEGCPAAGAPWCGADDHGPAALAAWGVLAVAAAVGSSLVVAAATEPVLSVLAGSSWPVRGPLARFTAWRLRRHRKRFDAAVRELARTRRVREHVEAPAVEPGDPDVPGTAGVPGLTRRDELLNSGRAGRAGDVRLRYPDRPGPFPLGHPDVAPTRIGNSFAAMAGRVRARHGLDLAACWALIDTSLPAALRGPLEEESARVASRAQNLLWAALSALAAVSLGPLGGGPPAVWLPLAAVTAGTSWLLHRGLGGAVDSYCDRIEAVLVAARTALYETAGWPLPRTVGEEPEAGRALSAYLQPHGASAVPDTDLLPQPTAEPPAAQLLVRPAPQTPSAPSAPPVPLPSQEGANPPNRS